MRCLAVRMPVAFLESDLDDLSDVHGLFGFGQYPGSRVLAAGAFGLLLALFGRVGAFFDLALLRQESSGACRCATGKAELTWGQVR